jgi:hypothetical protein
MFKRRKRTGAPQDSSVLDPTTHIETLQPAESHQRAMRAGSGLLRILPIGDLLKGLFSILKDPNGKISSKRAGAGALVVAGITYVADPVTFQAGIVCLVASVLLFALTKFDTPTR